MMNFLDFLFLKIECCRVSLEVWKRAIINAASGGFSKRVIAGRLHIDTAIDKILETLPEGSSIFKVCVIVMTFYLL